MVNTIRVNTYFLFFFTLRNIFLIKCLWVKICMIILKYLNWLSDFSLVSPNVLALGAVDRERSRVLSVTGN